MRSCPCQAGIIGGGRVAPCLAQAVGGPAFPGPEHQSRLVTSLLGGPAGASGTRPMAQPCPGSPPSSRGTGRPSGCHRAGATAVLAAGRRQARSGLLSGADAQPRSPHGRPQHPCPPGRACAWCPPAGSGPLDQAGAAGRRPPPPGSDTGEGLPGCFWPSERTACPSSVGGSCPGEGAGGAASGEGGSGAVRGSDPRGGRSSLRGRDTGATGAGSPARPPPRPGWRGRPAGDVHTTAGRSPVHRPEGQGGLGLLLPHLLCPLPGHPSRSRDAWDGEAPTRACGRRRLLESLTHKAVPRPVVWLSEQASPAPSSVPCSGAPRRTHTSSRGPLWQDARQWSGVGRGTLNALLGHCPVSISLVLLALLVLTLCSRPVAPRLFLFWFLKRAFCFEV